jgi:hypothetical protein
MANISKKPDFIFLPSAVKESKAYSQTPNDGTGDFIFYRNSTTTRINEKGQVERWPKNLYPSSETFQAGGFWTKINSTVVDNTAIAPNGTLTAATLTDNSTTGRHTVYYQDNPVISANTISIYAKANTATWLSLDLYNTQDRFTYFDLVNGVIGTVGTGITATMTYVGNGWYRCSCSTSSSTNGWIHFGVADSNGVDSYAGTGKSIFVWGFQRELGSAPTAYMPTTTRLNLPTIDYSDGGPTLLLNPERTNLAIYSEDFSNAVWTKQSGISVTTNQVIAPDGTLTADLVIGAGNSHGIYQANNAPVSSSLPNTKSIWMRGVNGGEVVILKDPHLTIGTLSCTLTKSWQRFVLTETQTIGTAGLWVASIPTTGIYLWGAQIENAPNASSYIPTIGSTVTRVLEGGITNFIPKSNRVTVYAEFKLESTGQNVALYGFRPAGAGYTVSNIYYLYLWGTDSNKFGFNTANGDLYGITNSTIADGKYHKVIAVFDYTNFANNELYIDGVKQTISQVKGTTTQITTKNNFSTLYAQGTTSADEDPRIAYREMAIWDTELTDAECIDLTFQTSLSNALVNKHRQLVLGSGGVVEAENLLNNNLTNLK